MKEFDEDEAIQLMNATLADGRRSVDGAQAVLDLIYDFYDDNGDLDINLDDEDEDETDVDEMVKFIAKYLRKNPADIAYTDDEIRAMVEAEIAYENSLL